MNKHSSIKSTGSLLERASEMYDFGAALRNGAPAPISPAPAPNGASPVQSAPPPAEPQPGMEFTAPIEMLAPTAQSAPAAHPAFASKAPAAPRTEVGTPVSIKRHNGIAKIDRQMLTDNNFINPEGPVTGQVEEFRIVKRQLLLAARGGKGYDPVEHGERILVCSAHPNEGKTFCAVNLALSMAREKDNRVLLIDADFAKPSVLKTLGIEQAPGLMDALADPNCDVESLVIETDVNGLSVLPAGDQTNQDTEYLAASRTASVIDQLSRNDPSRIIIFDSPPALAASPASVLATHVGQCLMVVRADETTDSALRDALSLLSGCDNIQLLLNRAKFSPTGRKFGSYYGYGA
jgi:exopolysaccharide/PEP-CTERM locus tyrosine autokinase